MITSAGTAMQDDGRTGSELVETLTLLVLIGLAVVLIANLIGAISVLG